MVISAVKKLETYVINTTKLRKGAFIYDVCVLGGGMSMETDISYKTKKLICMKNCKQEGRGCLKHEKNADFIYAPKEFVAHE